ncbi:MarR family winged helix-turn-helix transcriptional regulator [Parapusillimonas granuli]|nr:MarR family winged helix-turn-helix transcriptional regulator [Parapusillimonas granuli]
MIEWGNHFSRRHELTSARWQVLGAISMAPQAPSIPQIAAAMGVTRQGVQKQIRLLVDEGLVPAPANPTHKRSPLHALTAKGRDIYGSLTERWHEHVGGMAAEFKAADLDAAIRVLSAMSRGGFNMDAVPVSGPAANRQEGES